VEIIRRAPPPKGVNVIPFGGGVVGSRHFEVDLDAHPPTVTTLDAEFDPEKAVDFPYKVSRTDPEVFTIIAYTQKCDCSWRAHLRWTYHGEKGSTAIDNGGQPFRTVSSANATPYIAREGRFKPG